MAGQPPAAAVDGMVEDDIDDEEVGVFFSAEPAPGKPHIASIELEVGAVMPAPHSASPIL